MNDRQGLLTLVAEIRGELSTLTRLARELSDAWARGAALPAEERRIYTESAALKLHNLYTACERVFERVAGGLNGGVPSSHDWHLRLLRSMTVEVPGLRPRVLSPDTTTRLGEYLRFRHSWPELWAFLRGFG